MTRYELGTIYTNDSDVLIEEAACSSLEYESLLLLTPIPRSPGSNLEFSVT